MYNNFHHHSLPSSALTPPNPTFIRASAFSAFTAAPAPSQAQNSLASTLIIGSSFNKSPSARDSPASPSTSYYSYSKSPQRTRRGPQDVLVTAHPVKQAAVSLQQTAYFHSVESSERRKSRPASSTTSGLSSTAALANSLQQLGLSTLAHSGSAGNSQSLALQAIGASLGSPSSKTHARSHSSNNSSPAPAATLDARYKAATAEIAQAMRSPSSSHSSTRPSASVAPPAFSPAAQILQSPKSSISAAASPRDLQVLAIRQEWENSGRKSTQSGLIEFEYLPEAKKSAKSPTPPRLSSPSLSSLINQMTNNDSSSSSSPPLYNHLLLYGHSALSQLFSSSLSIENSPSSSSMIHMIFSPITHISIHYCDYNTYFYQHIQQGIHHSSSSSSSSATASSSSMDSVDSQGIPLEIPYSIQNWLKLSDYFPRISSIALVSMEILHLTQLKPILWWWKEDFHPSLALFHNPIGKFGGGGGGSGSGGLLKSFAMGYLKASEISFSTTSGPIDMAGISPLLGHDSIQKWKSEIQSYSLSPSSSSSSMEYSLADKQWSSIRTMEFQLIHREIYRPIGNSTQKRFSKRLSEKIIEISLLKQEKIIEFHHQWPRAVEEFILRTWENIQEKEKKTGEEGKEEDEEEEEERAKDKGKFGGGGNSRSETPRVVAPPVKSAGPVKGRPVSSNPNFHQKFSTPSFASLSPEAQEEALNQAAVDSLKAKMQRMFQAATAPLMPGSGGHLQLQNQNAAFYAQIPAYGNSTLVTQAPAIGKETGKSSFR